jgi:hypothetical protein
VGVASEVQHGMALLARRATQWPLSSQGVRLCWLRACCAVAEGAEVPLTHADTCVGAVLGDALHRVSVLGGREGMARSLAACMAGV